MTEAVRTMTADRGDAGRRLDLVVQRHLSDVGAATRTRVQRWISAGLVTVNGAPITRVSARTAFGDVVQVALPEAHRPRPMDAEPGPLAVLYEDDDVLAVNKPAGVVVHPTYRNTRNTVMNALLWYARDWPANRRPSLVGRLDKDTSGLLLVAKASAIHRDLQEAGESGRIDKDYLAVVHGQLRHARAIDRPLGRDPEDRRRVIVTGRGARSLTLVEPLARSQGPAGSFSLVWCRLVTGRTHQIRVHLEAEGHPLVGDPLYGSHADRGIGWFSRQALHAWRLTFAHPASRESVAMEAPIPGDLQQLLNAVNLVTPVLTRSSA